MYNVNQLLCVSAADKAYREMKALKESQSIIVSGEHQRYPLKFYILIVN